MKIGRFILIMLLGVMLVGSTACGGPGATPTSTPTPTPDSAISAEDWDALNNWLSELYGLTPVDTVEELESAAWLISGYWFDAAHEACSKMEQHDIPWERTAPFCYLFYWYIETDIALRNVTTPRDLMAEASHLIENVTWLHEEADALVEMKLMGESLRIYPTEEACVEGWVNR